MLRKPTVLNLGSQLSGSNCAGSAHLHSHLYCTGSAEFMSGGEVTLQAQHSWQEHMQKPMDKLAELPAHLLMNSAELAQQGYSLTGQSRHDEFLLSFLSHVEFQKTNRLFLFFLA